uniref:Uncharacterized protein n=1 Tax=Hucho hucho TaxID=62062 RepID=A0A4W5N242_9TELE
MPFSRRFYPNKCLANRWKIIRRWKNIRSEGYRAKTTYCRKHFLTRTALITKDIKQELIRMMDQVVFSSSSKSGRGPASRDRSDPGGAQAPLTPLGKAQICVLNAVVMGGLCDSVGRILYTPSVDVLDRVACSVETSQGKAHVHPSSFNRCLLFQEKVRWIEITIALTFFLSICISINRPSIQFLYLSLWWVHLTQEGTEVEDALKI